MDLTKLLELKEKMISATKFVDPWTFFLDHFGEKDEFLRLRSEVSEKDRKDLLSIISTITSRLYGDKGGKIINPKLAQISEYHFIHGGAFLQGGVMLTVIFFSDIQLGILCLIEMRNVTEALLVRFSEDSMEYDKTTFQITIKTSLPQ